MKQPLESKDFFQQNNLPIGGLLNGIPASGDRSSSKNAVSGSKSAKKWQMEARTDPDAALAEAFISGDDEAFIRLYAKYEVSLFYYCKRMLHNTPAAEDVFQESWARIFELRRRADSPHIAHFRGLLFHTARNLCWSALHTGNQIESIESSSENEDSFDEKSEFSVSEAMTGAASGREIEALMVQALARLPFDQRETFILHEYSGFTYPEIAEMMNVPERNVKVRAYRARIRLRKFIQGWLGLGEDDDPGNYI